MERTTTMAANQRPAGIPANAVQLHAPSFSSVFYGLSNGTIYSVFGSKVEIIEYPVHALRQAWLKVFQPDQTDEAKERAHQELMEREGWPFYVFVTSRWTVAAGFTSSYKIERHKETPPIYRNPNAQAYEPKFSVYGPFTSKAGAEKFIKDDNR